MGIIELTNKLETYIKLNPNLLNNEEKQMLKSQFTTFLQNSDKRQSVHEILLDFLIYEGIVPSSEDKFLEYVIKKYPKEQFPRILEVASGKVCSLAQGLKKNGYRVTAMDPEIRIKPNDPRVKGIKLMKRKFTPDFKTSNYDLVLGYNACPMAGTLLNIKDKPTIFTICDRPETDGKLDIGIDIHSKREFVDELAKRGGRIQYVGELTIVDNARVLEIKTPMEEKDKNER